MKIVTFAGKKIGDTVMATPLYRALRALYPEAVIDVVTEINKHPVLEGIGLFNQEIPFSETIDFSLYDLAVMPVFCCQEAVETAGRSAKRYIGLRELYPVRPPDFRKRLTSAYAHMLFEKHQVELNMDIVRSLGYQGDTPEAYCPAPETELYPQLKGKIGLCIYTPQNQFQAGQHRLWPLEHWMALIAGLGKDRVVIVGGEMDRPNAQAVSAACGCSLQLSASIAEFVGICRQLKLLITTDHGAMHIAATAGVPIISLHGTSSPVLLHPWVGKQGKSLSILSPVFCSPCQRSYRVQLCEKGVTTMRCMKQITPELVIKAVGQISKLKSGESRILFGKKLMSLGAFRHNWKVLTRHFISISLSREVIRWQKLMQR